MKIIFLDHDGVICLPPQQGGRFKKQKKWGERKMGMDTREIPIQYRFDNFDKKSIKTLNKILEESDAEIVISSDWRKLATLEEIGEYYELQGIIKKPIGFTDIFKYEWVNEGGIMEDFRFYEGDDRIRFSRNDEYEQIRVLEITKWLNEHPEVTQWVAIDDLILGKFIYTYYSNNQPIERDWGLINFVQSNWYMGIQQSGLKDKILKYLKNEITK